MLRHSLVALAVFTFSLVTVIKISAAQATPMMSPKSAQQQPEYSRPRDKEAFRTLAYVAPELTVAVADMDLTMAQRESFVRFLGGCGRVRQPLDLGPGKAFLGCRECLDAGGHRWSPRHFSAFAGAIDLPFLLRDTEQRMSEDYWHLLRILTC
jgi:hypothetical protein